MVKDFSQWLFLVPVKGGIGGIVHPPIGRKNTTYIPLIVLAFWGVICYHLLGEPETTIDTRLITFCIMHSTLPMEPARPPPLHDKAPLQDDMAAEHEFDRLARSTSMGGVDKGWYKELMEGEYISVWLDGLASCTETHATVF